MSEYKSVSSTYKNRIYETDLNFINVLGRLDFKVLVLHNM